MTKLQASNLIILLKKYITLYKSQPIGVDMQYIKMLEALIDDVKYVKDNL